MELNFTDPTRVMPGRGSSFRGGLGAPIDAGGASLRIAATPSDSGHSEGSPAPLSDSTATMSFGTATPTNRTPLGLGVSGDLASALAQAPATAATLAPAPAPAPAPSARPPSVVLSQATSHPQAFQFRGLHASHSPSSTPSQSASSQAPAHNSILHVHRQTNSSSKLPAYRFADSNKSATAQPILLQSHSHRRDRHHQHIPPSSVALNLAPQPETRPDTRTDTVNQSPRPTLTDRQIEALQNRKRKIVSAAPSIERFDQIRSRASTFQSASALLSTTTSSPHAKRALSLDPNIAFANATDVRSTTVSTETASPLAQRRALTFADAPLGLGIDPASGGLPTEVTTKDNSSGQPELSLLKTFQQTVSENRTSENRRASILKKPPVSYRPRAKPSGSGTSASVPPIRSSGTTGERRSVVLDMNARSTRHHDGVDDMGDANHRDRTLRTLEGRRGEENTQLTPPSSNGERPDGDDSGDLFLRIAREDSSQRNGDTGRVYADRPNAITRVARSSRRPLSVAVSSYRSPSPPHLSRRMSSQEQGERTGPPISFRGHSREPQSEDFKFKGVSTPLRSSPLSPRTMVYHDASDSSSAHRRRQPSVDRAAGLASRMASIKQANVNYSHPRTYNSSPLVSHTADAPKQDAQPNESAPVEGTDSTLSTGGSSTVWDELEELKSRIHRLELTGKLPSTSSAAISRASEERPPTAHTSATTLSVSPKNSGSNVVLQSVEAPILPKDSHPLLHSALAKSKDFLVPDVYDALEMATADALALAALMGTAGQPGPISSGSSNIGSTSGTVTDRQLRKKADSVCRSLTELCLALSENARANKPHQIASLSPEDSFASPTVTHFQRRPSIPANRVIEHVASPRAPSRYDEKRVIVQASSAVPHSRHNSNAPTTIDGATAGRKSSLLFARSRRAGTEEPEDGRRTSSLLRSRRAGTEEPEDVVDRKPILSRGRRATLDPGEDESRFRTPSRAITEVNGTRPREYLSHPPPPPILKNGDTLANSALPRKRMVATSINTRLSQPAIVTSASTASAIATPSRRYFDYAVPSQEIASEADRQPQQHFALARSGSQNRRITNRQSMIATPSKSAANYYR